VRALLFGALPGHVLCAVAAAATLLAQEKIPFKSGASTDAVYATVTDAAGRLAPDLPQESFEVYDNGKRQTISTFASGVQPITIVVMLDRSLSMLANATLVEQAAAALVDRLLPADKARIGSFSSLVLIDPPDFTSDQRELHAILAHKLLPPGGTPLWSAMGLAMTALRHQQGRRVVLVFTDGKDQPLDFRGPKPKFKDIVKRAEQEDVMVYAIGLASSPVFLSGLRPIVGRDSLGPDPGLEKLALASGGGYFELTAARDLAATFTRVVDKLHRQYLIGFVPQTLDGKVHTLDVRVRGDGLAVRARKSYVAAR
jgi:VWFA-related protein